MGVGIVGSPRRFAVLASAVVGAVLGTVSEPHHFVSQTSPPRSRTTPTTWFAVCKLEMASLFEARSVMEEAISAKTAAAVSALPDPAEPTNVGRKIRHPAVGPRGEVWVQRELVPQVLRTALFIAAYANFEQHLWFLCKRQGGLKRSKVHLTDLRHKGIEGSAFYLKNVIGLNFPDGIPEWSRVRDLGVVRNHLVHAGAWVSEESDRLRAAVARLQLIALLDEDEVYLERDFFPFCMAQYERVLLEIDNLLEQ